MLTNNSSAWIDFVRHILKEEGGKSKDPRDTASACVPVGKIHTNKGVTYCTYKEKAEKLGLNPSYDAFLKLTDLDAAKFIYTFYMSVNGLEFPDSVALILTESAWGSGPKRAWEHLYKALDNLGQTGTNKQEAIKKANILPEKVLFDELVKVRRQYLEFLLKLPKYSAFTGWIPRLKRFYESFNPVALTGKKKIYLVLAAFSIIYLIIKNVKK